MWRGGGRIGLSVSAPFVWRCLNSRAMTPFPHPAHRTGRADFPHPALGQDLTPSPTARFAQAGSDVRARSARKGARVNCPISWSLTTSCVCLELRSLPSAGVTRPQRYYGPLRHPREPGLSLAGVRLIISDHPVGLPVLLALSLCTCCCHYPGAAPGPSHRSSTQAYQPSPKGSSGRPAHRPFRGLLDIHSRCGLHTRAVTYS